MNTTLNYSPNFDVKKRKKIKIKFKEKYDSTFR